MPKHLSIEIAMPEYDDALSPKIEKKKGKNNVVLITRIPYNPMNTLRMNLNRQISLHTRHTKSC